MRLTDKIKIAGAASAALLVYALPAAAQVDLGLSYAGGIGLPPMDIRTYVANIIRAFLGLTGFFLVMKIMHGGFLMMTHGGDEEAREEAVGVLKDGIIGFVIIMTSVSLAKFVVNAIANAAGNANLF